MVWLLVGCGSSSKELDPEALEAKAVDGIRRLAAVYDLHANDCDKLATALEAWGTEYTPVMQAMKNRAPAAGADTWHDRHGDAFGELRDKSRQALARCATNRAVIKASQTLKLD